MVLVRGEMIITVPIAALANLRLLPTFAGGLQEKNRTCAGFNKIPKNYISEESLINKVYDKSIV